MLTFKNPAEFARHLERIRDVELRRCFISILQMVGDEAKRDAQDRIIGRVRPLEAVGPFNAWEYLKASTIAQKERKGWGKGGNPNTILWATGEMAASIEYRVEKGRLRVIVGSNDQIALYQELGTIKMPPRPFLGPAMIRTVDKYYFRMEKMLGFTLKGRRIGRL